MASAGTANNNQVSNEGEQDKIAQEDNSNKGEDNIVLNSLASADTANNQANKPGEKVKEWDFKDWGGSSYLTKSDVNVIEGCPGGIGCCECCHIKPCCCNGCFTFPRHPTVNLFYTPTMFTTYHREGYRACMECDDFLLDINTQ